MKPSPQRTRRDPRREATRIALIERAETMFADGGVDGVSLKQISAAIGSANNGVVAYYFGTKEALIEAIYRYRLPVFEQRRTTLLAKAENEGRGEDFHTLMRVLCLPLFEQTNARGQHSYAGFLSSLSRSGWEQTWQTLNKEFTVTQEIIDRIERLVPDKTRPMFKIRLSISIGILYSALSIIDRHTDQKDPTFAEYVFNDAVRMVSGAIVSPPIESYDN